MNESDLILDPEVKARLEQVLGIEVPDPNSLEFQTLLEELQETQPDLFEEVMRGLTVNVEFPAEQQAGKVARRESFAALVNRLVFRRSTVDGAPVAAKRRWLMYVFAAAAILGPGLYIFGQTLGRSTNEPEEVTQLAQITPVEPTQPETQLSKEPEPEPEPEVTPPPPVTLPTPPKQTIPAPPTTATPTPPRPVTPTPPAAAAPAPVQPKEAPVVRPSTMSLYQDETSRPAQMSLFSNERAEGEEMPGLTVFTDEAAPDTLLIASVEDTAPDTLSLPVGENPNATQRPTQLRVGESEDETAEQAVVVEGGLPAQPGGELPAGTEPQAGVPSGTPQGQGEGAVQAPGKLLESILKPGAKIGAVLETGIVLTPGAFVPVVAKSGSEWCTTPPCPEITWIGQAALDASGRVQLYFTEAVFDDAAQTIEATALGAGNTPGLGATIKDTAPTVAQDLLRSAAGGFADYIGVLSQQQKVSFVNGMPVTETQTPPLDLFILGKVGNVFDLPDNATPIVRIAEVPAGAQLIVLFGIPPAGLQGTGQE